MGAPAACRGEGQFPLMPGKHISLVQGNPRPGTAATIQPNTIAMETGANRRSQRAEVRADWLVITPEPCLLPLCSDIWAVLKGLTL